MKLDVQVFVYFNCLFLFVVSPQKLHLSHFLSDEGLKDFVVNQALLSPGSIEITLSVPLNSKFFF